MSKPQNISKFVLKSKIPVWESRMRIRINYLNNSINWMTLKTQIKEELDWD
jgi:hypothetical protein